MNIDLCLIQLVCGLFNMAFHCRFAHGPPLVATNNNEEGTSSFRLFRPLSLKRELSKAAPMSLHINAFIALADNGLPFDPVSRRLAVARRVDVIYNTVVLTKFRNRNSTAVSTQGMAPYLSGRGMSRKSKPGCYKVSRVPRTLNLNSTLTPLNTSYYFIVILL